ncbi:MAG TPA: exodeoxyribonuclease I, partial [Cellvibrio sp.]
NFPSSLTAAEQQRWREFCCWRLTSPEAQSSLTLGEFDQRVAKLMDADEASEQQRSLLKELLLYADKLKANC